MVTLCMIPDPNLSFSLTELKNDRFTDICIFLQTSLKRSFFNSVNKKLRFGSGIMQRVTVSVFCQKKNAKITVLETFNLLKWSFLRFFGQKRTHTLVACLQCVTRKISLREQKSGKKVSARKIVGIGYHLASNIGTYRDKCFVR